MMLAAIRKVPVDMRCPDTITSYLFYAVIVDFFLEALDFIHRLYQSEESVKILGKLITHNLFMSLFVLQILIGMFIPLGNLIQLGIFSTRWNVVIGGQLFSKSFRG